MQKRNIVLMVFMMSICSLVAQEYNIPECFKVAKNSNGNSFCQYPTQFSAAIMFQAFGAPGTMEQEPNNNTINANPAITAAGQDLDITAQLTSSDRDSYRLEVQKGDVIGIAVTGAGLDSIIGIYNGSGQAVITNDDHSGVATFYPSESPFPAPSSTENSALTWIAPQNGTFFVVVSGFDAGTTGNYTLKIRSRRPFLETQPRGTKQIIFLDFDGATINSQSLFGQGKSSATLSPLIDFLPRWDLTAFEERQVVNAIIATIQQDLDSLRSKNPNMDFEIQNSMDHPDPFSLPNVSRVIIGGTIAEIGFSTIGIASSVDPGNFKTDDTAVVLLDLLSESSSNANSINNLQLAPNFSKINAVGLVVGKVTLHEIGHFLGNWHTNNENGSCCIMDQGGNLKNTSGIGNDNKLGSADDKAVKFIADDYMANEGIGTGKENTDIRAAFGLSKGK